MGIGGIMSRSNDSKIIPLLPRRAGDASIREMVIDGRRYKLVPLDDEEPAPSPRGPSDLLTERELQVAALVAEGRVNKQIAGALQTCVRTVKSDRAHVMQTFRVHTLADLRVLTTKKPGDEVALVLERAGWIMRRRVVLGSRPKK